MSDKLPKGWAATTLGEIRLDESIGISQAQMRGETFELYSVPAFESRSADIVHGDTIGSNKNVVQYGDVLLCKINPRINRAWMVAKPNVYRQIASTEWVVFSMQEGIIPEFLVYFFSQDIFRNYLSLNVSGVGGSLMRVNAHVVGAYPINLPPTREQERIVAKLNAVLSKISRAETAAHRAQERLKRYRAAILDAALAGDLTRNWRKAHSRSKQEDRAIAANLSQHLLASRRSYWEKVELKRLRNKGKTPKNDRWKSRYAEPVQPDTINLPKLPSTWIWASLDMIAELGSGISVSQNRVVKNPVELPYLRVANVMRGYLDLREIKKIRIERDQAPNYLLNANDILFNEGGDRDKLGRGWVWEGQIRNCVHQNHVFRARLFDPTLLNPQLVSHWGNTFGQRFFEKHGTQTTNLASINRRVLGKLPVPIAPIEEQTEILRQVEHRLASVDRMSSRLERQLERARATRNSLLDQAFNGRLVPQNPNDENALVLLERIRVEKVKRLAEQKGFRRVIQPPTNKESDSMQRQPSLPKSLTAVWKKTQKLDARQLFREAGFGPENVVQFYEALRAAPQVRTAFQNAAKKQRRPQKLIQHGGKMNTESKGRFRLVDLWLEDFKNLKDYTIHFDPAHGLDVILGWNGTGKSNLFEALVIIFRDLYDWSEKNRWPIKPMTGYRITYEIDEYTVEIIWRPGVMKRPTIKRAPIIQKEKKKSQRESITRNQLPLPRFIFGYYSGPTNRLAEHFLPMKQAHYVRLREAKADDAGTLAELLEQRRFFCAETHHAKYVLLAFSYKEDPKISEFLKDRLRILGFESALFIIRKPRWAKPGSNADDFWGATGIMRRVMERLRRFAIAPMVLEQTVSSGYRSTTEDHYYFFLPDPESLHSFAAEYQDARSFFLALESTDFSELIHDVKIQVRIKATNTDQVAITFHQLSEGEQQLLMVLGLMRFTKSHQSLVLLDEPDTHLNPHWSVDYLKDLTHVMSENALESTEQQSSQILMATHDPLVIASLVKEQIHLLKRDSKTGACNWAPASVNPRGLGFTGILTSEMFGFRSDLDPETLADLDTRVRLVAKESSLTAREKKELELIDKRLIDAGFSKAFSDPYYAAFVRAWGRRHSALMAGEQSLTSQKRQKIEQIANQVLKEAIAEVEKEVTG